MFQGPVYISLTTDAFYLPSYVASNTDTLLELPYAQAVGDTVVPNEFRKVANFDHISRDTPKAPFGLHILQAHGRTTFSKRHQEQTQHADNTIYSRWWPNINQP